jgi:hypothetical protein
MNYKYSCLDNVLGLVFMRAVCSSLCCWGWSLLCLRCDWNSGIKVLNIIRDFLQCILSDSWRCRPLVSYPND